MRAIKRTGAAVAETGKGPVLRAIHDESIVMHQERGASTAGAMLVQERMAEAGLPAPWPHTVHERREAAEVATADAQRTALEERTQAAWAQWHTNTAEAEPAAHDPWDMILSAHYPPLIDALRAPKWPRSSRTTASTAAGPCPPPLPRRRSRICPVLA